MSHFTPSATIRAALVAATVALFASHAAYAAQPKEMSDWAQAQTSSRAAEHGPQFASRATDAHEHGGFAQTASRAGDASDRGVSAQYASRAGDRDDGGNAAA